MEFLKIILLSVLAAVVYGILHDQVTTRICVEYFTIGHPPVFYTDNPTLLSLGWGTIATWWVGFVLGIPLVLVSRLGSWPRFDAAHLARPIVCLQLITASMSLLAGIAGYFLARAGVIGLKGPLGFAVPPDKHVAFLVDALAHLAAYGVGFVGGVILCLWVWIRRRQMAIERRFHESRSEACRTAKGNRT
jgi:uncharacterized membrane protein